MLHGLMNAWSLSLFEQNLSNSKRPFHKTIYAISMTPLFPEFNDKILTSGAQRWEFVLVDNVVVWVGGLATSSLVVVVGCCGAVPDGSKQ